MSKFQKKPVIIEATQWFKNGDHPLDYAKDNVDLTGMKWTGKYRKKYNWEGDIVRYFRHPEIEGELLCFKCGAKMHDHGWIDTLEDGLVVCPGDYIITGIKGEHYPCKPDIFIETYEAVIEGNPKGKKLDSYTLEECLKIITDYPTSISVHATRRDAKIATQLKNELILAIKTFTKGRTAE